MSDFTHLFKTITVIVSERSSPFPPVVPWPLIYTVDVMNPRDKDEILRQVADIRYDELGCQHNDDGTQSDVVYEIMNGLDLHFAFEGDQSTCQDWRK